MSRSSSVFAAILALVPLPGWSQGIIATFAGTDWIFQGDQQQAANAPLGEIYGLAVDKSGSYYFADANNFIIGKVGPDGVLTVIAGNGLRGTSGDGGPATAASLWSPNCVTVDTAGNVYSCDLYCVRKVSLDGVITTFAGAAIMRSGYSGDGGPATEALLDVPTSLAFDSAGNLYVADSRNYRVRKVSTSGIITTIAGNGQAEGTTVREGVPATSEPMYPVGLAVDTAGNVFVSTYLRVRKISPSGIITTVAGRGCSAPPGDGGPATQACLQPEGLALDAAGNLYIADRANHRIRRVNGQGIITTIAGSGSEPGFGGDGGPATSALLNAPRAVALDTTGSLYIADSQNNRVRKLSTAGTIVTVAGNGQFRTSGNGGPAVAAVLNTPVQAVVDRAGNLYFAELGNHAVRRVGADGVITLVAGGNGRGFGGDGGPATRALLNQPSAVAFDSAGNLYIADTWNFRLRKVAPNGVISTFAGGGGSFAEGIPAINAYLTLPTGVAVDAAGNVYAISGHAVRRIAPNGNLTTYAGTGMYGSTGDGGPATAATIALPMGLAADAAGNLYISEAAKVRKVDRNGIITTVTGGGPASATGDGPATEVRLVAPYGLAVDRDGGLLIAETGAHKIRKLTPGGALTTVAGTGRPGYSGDGGPAASATFQYPQGVAVDASGNIFMSDSWNSRVRVVLPAPPSFRVSAAELEFSAVAGGPAPPVRRLDLAGSIPGLVFSVTTETSDGGAWLQVSPRGGAMPSSLEITADPLELASGDYSATITIISPDASPATQTVAVRFRVEAPAPPRLGVKPASLSFAAAERGATSSETVSVINQGGGSLEFSATASAAWLRLSPESGTATATAPGSLTVTADPAALRPGTYTARVVISSATTGETVSVPVIMTVTAVQQTILVSQTGLAFTAVAGGGVVPPQAIGILNTGRGVMEWTAGASTLAGGASWLTVGPASGSSDASSLRVPLVDVGINPGGLQPGEYYGQVLIRAPAADNTPQTVTVVLTVLPAGSDPGPLIRPSGLIFTGLVGGPAPSSQTVQVSNLAAEPKTYASGRLTFDGGNWLTHLPTNSTVQPSLPTRIVVQPEIEGLAAGIRRASVNLLFSDGTTRTVQVLYVVIGGGGAGGASAPAAGCAASRLLPLFTSLAENFTSAVGWPLALEVRVVDDCGQPMAAGSVMASFSNGDPPLALASLKDGRWTGTWQPRSAQVSQVAITVTAHLAESGARGESRALGALRTDGVAPLVAAGQIVSTAALAPDLPLAPGSLITVFGARLAEQEAAAPGLPLTTELGGTRLFIGGRPAPLGEVGAGRISGVVPFGLPTNARHQVVVQRGRAYAPPEVATIAEAQPAVFTQDNIGTGQGLIYILPVDGSPILAEAANPAKVGDAIEIRCAGLGAVDPPVADGAAAPESPVASVVSPVAVSIGGVAAEVTSAYLAPGRVGVYLVRATVPEGVSPSDQAPIVVEVAGQQSPPVTMAVR